MSEGQRSLGSVKGAGDALTGQVPAQLVRDLRRLQRWFIVLTVLVALLVAAMVVAAVLVPRAIREQQQADGVPVGPTAEQVASTRDEIKAALDDRLASLETRLVTMEFDDPAMPTDAPEEQFIYVRYRLRDSGVLVADLTGGPFGTDPASMGMLPTQGSLQSRMTEQQFARFLAASGGETSAPLSNVRRYSARSR